MAAEGGTKIVKYLMFFFNFIFFVSGLVIIIGGALVFAKYNDYVDFTGSMGNAIPIILIVVGVFILFTGFVGCCGALRENYCMICTFALIMVVLLLVELGGGIAAYVLRDDIENAIQTNMEDLMQNYTNVNATKKLFDGMQKDVMCCGTQNYTDWYEFLGPNTVPDSCCQTPATDCGKSFTTESIYTSGCYMKLYDLLQDNIVIIGAIAITIALVQIFGVVCSCCLMRSIKSEYEVV